MTRGSAEAKYTIDKFQGIGPAISPGVAVFPTELVGIGATQPGVWSYWGGQSGVYSLSPPSGSSLNTTVDDGIGGMYAADATNLYRSPTGGVPSFLTAGPLANYAWLIAYGFGVTGLQQGTGDQLLNLALGDAAPYPPTAPTATVTTNPSSTLAAGTYRVVSLYTTQSSGGLTTVFQMGVTATFTVAANQQVVVNAGSPGRYYLQRTDIIEPYLRFVGAVGQYSFGLVTTITSDPPLQSVFIMGQYLSSPSYNAQYNGRAFYYNGALYLFGPDPNVLGRVVLTPANSTPNVAVYSDAGYSNFSLGSNILTPKSNKGYGGLTGMVGNATGLYIAWPGELHQIQSDFVIGGRYQETEPLEPIGSAGVIGFGGYGTNKTLVSVGNMVYTIFKGRIFEIRGGSIGEISQPVYPSVITSGSPFQYLEYDVASGDIVAGTGSGALFRYNLFTKQWMNDISLINPYFYRNASGLVVYSNPTFYFFGTGGAPYVTFRNLDLGAPSQRKSIEGVECFIDGATTSTVILDITIDGVSTTVNGIKRGTSSWFFRLPGKIGQLINYMRIRLNGQPAVQMRPPLIIHFSSSQELGY